MMKTVVLFQIFVENMIWLYFGYFKELFEI